MDSGGVSPTQQVNASRRVRPNPSHWRDRQSRPHRAATWRNYQARNEGLGKVSSDPGGGRNKSKSSKSHVSGKWKRPRKRPRRKWNSSTSEEGEGDREWNGDGLHSVQTCEKTDDTRGKGFLNVSKRNLRVQRKNLNVENESIHQKPAAAEYAANCASKTRRELKKG